MVAKLAHANPMTVLRTIVQQVCGTKIVCFLSLVRISLFNQKYHILQVIKRSHLLKEPELPLEKITEN
jgi:hypothetical protein